MSDSSDEEFDNNYVMYRHRREWSDVQPLKQNDGPNPIVAIAYSERCENCFCGFAIGFRVISNPSSSRRLRLFSSNYRISRKVGEGFGPNKGCAAIKCGELHGLAISTRNTQAFEQGFE